MKKSSIALKLTVIIIVMLLLAMAMIGGSFYLTAQWLTADIVDQTSVSVETYTAALGDIIEAEHLESDLIVLKSKTEDTVNTIFLVFTGAMTGLTALMFFIVFVIIRKMISPLKELASNTEVMATGDYSQDLSERLMKNKNEIGSLSRTTQKMIDHLRDLIGSIDESSDKVIEFSELIQGKGTDITANSKEISVVINQLSSDILNQAEHAREGEKSMKRLEKIINHTEKQIEEVYRHSNVLLSLIDSCNELIDEMNIMSQENEKRTREIVLLTQKTNESATEIENARHFISDIAEQTNLLALNAAVEAARTGEQGKGFAVVAEEIKSLSAESAESAAKIKNQLKSLMADVNNAIAATEKVEETNERRTEIEVFIKDKFRDAYDSIRNNNESIGTIAESSKEMTEYKDKTLDIVENLSNNAEISAMGTHQVIASIEEQTELLAEVSNEIKELHKDMVELQSRVRSFEV
jgi:methyl-accepting chemotaxis protein